MTEGAFPSHRKTIKTLPGLGGGAGAQGRRKERGSRLTHLWGGNQGVEVETQAPQMCLSTGGCRRGACPSLCLEILEGSSPQRESLMYHEHGARIKLSKL